LSLKKQQLPIWTINIIDCVIIIFSVVFAYLLRFNFSIPSAHLSSLTYIIPIVLVARFGMFYIFKTAASLIKYTSVEDVKKIGLAMFIGTLKLIALNAICLIAIGKHVIPTSIVIMELIFSTFFLLAFRVFVKLIYIQLRREKSEKINAIIYGAGEAGVMTRNVLEQEISKNYNIVAFVDDNPKLAGKNIKGVPIYEANKSLEHLVEEHKVKYLIISMFNVVPFRKSEILHQCIKLNVKVLQLPEIGRWINGELSVNQIQQVKLEDLLQREPIELDEKVIQKGIYNKKILVTGAAGSIGSEIARQLIRYRPQKVILLDQAETPLHNLKLEMQENIDFNDFEIVLADVRNERRMEKIFEHYQPDWVFHAAAYKHVPMMEDNPSEAILTNILGTKILADKAVKHNIDKFVYVSTDKAVNPSNVMGASKRISEIYVQSLNDHSNNSSTKFVTTRFGNVLGSNGSVIKLFRQQIEERRTVTVTHPEVTRFFMTIPEACQLVLEAGTMGKGGEIFIFDMGKSVKILDLAKNMIAQSGLELGKDIQIKFTGLRPGEKLYEELLTVAEPTTKTHNPKIMIAQVAKHNFIEVNEQVSEIINSFNDQDNTRIVSLIKAIVPEFISQNSTFQSLDNTQAS